MNSPAKLDQNPADGGVAATGSGRSESDPGFGTRACNHRRFRRCLLLKSRCESSKHAATIGSAMKAGQWQSRARGGFFLLVGPALAGLDVRLNKAGNSFDRPARLYAFSELTSATCCSPPKAVSNLRWSASMMPGTKRRTTGCAWKICFRSSCWESSRASPNFFPSPAPDIC
jgi:hypothetical protein